MNNNYGNAKGICKHGNISSPDSVSILWKQTFTHTMINGLQTKFFIIDAEGNIIISTISDIIKPRGKLLKIRLNGIVEQLDIVNGIPTMPSLSYDGLIYISCYNGSQKDSNRIMCFDNSLSLIWEIGVNGIPVTCPIIDDNKWCYSIIEQRKYEQYQLIKLCDNTGYENIFSLPSINISQPIMVDKIIFIPLAKGEILYAVTTDGKLLWKKKMNLSRLYINSMIINSLVFIITEDSIISVDTLGNVHTIYQQYEKNIAYGPSIDNSNNFYFNLSNSFLVSVNANCLLRWKQKLKGPPNLNPIIYKGDKILQSCTFNNDSFLQCFSIEGQPKWCCTINNEEIFSLVVDNDNIYITTIHNFKDDLLNYKWSLYVISEKY